MAQLPFRFVERPGEDIYRRQSRYERESEAYYSNPSEDPTKDPDAKDASMAGVPLPPDQPQTPSGEIWGIATLEAGTVLVQSPYFKADSLVWLSYQRINGNPGILSIVNKIYGVGFDILSTSRDDNSDVVYVISTENADGGAYS